VLFLSGATPTTERFLLPSRAAAAALPLPETRTREGQGVEREGKGEEKQEESRGSLTLLCAPAARPGIDPAVMSPGAIRPGAAVGVGAGAGVAAGAGAVDAPLEAPSFPAESNGVVC